MGLDQSIFRRRADGEVVEEIYWRKTNFVHYFFTHDWAERGFDGDNLVEFPVTEDNLRDLANCCYDVERGFLKPSDVLPTCSGFFWGKTDYDDLYFHDIHYTKHEVEDLLINRPLLEGEEFFYSAWY